MARPPKPPLMQPSVTVLLFGQLREAAGWERRELALNDAGDPPATPAALWRQLHLEGLGSPWRVAVNHHFVPPHAVLRPGDEVAFLPPISGG